MEPKCQKCSKTVQPDWLECPFCGVELIKEKLCPNCSKKVEPEWVKCPFCRTAIANTQDTSSAVTNFCGACGTPVAGTLFFKCQECLKITCFKCRAQHPEGKELPLCVTCGTALLKPLWERKRNEEILSKKYCSVLEKGWFGLIDMDSNFYSEVVPLLVKTGKDINEINKDSRFTPVSVASRKGKLELVKLLVENGADVNKVNQTPPPIYYAAYGGHIEIVKFLMGKGAVDLSLALNGSANTGHLEIVKLLLHKVGDVNVRGSGGGTTLMSASCVNVEVIRFLLDKGADVNVSDFEGRTALIYSGAGGNVEIISLLLDKGADVNAKDNAGVTALFWAARQGNIEAVRFLLGKGADINAKITEDQIFQDQWYIGETALKVASRLGHKEIEKLLRGKGAV